ncbi:MAG TPA: hypothetical protein VGM81_00080 [Burkholderiaceae bacterium]|jgi:hypothetical protein
MKYSHSQTFGTHRSVVATRQDKLTVLKREAQAWMAAMPIAILVSAVVAGLRASGR